MTGQLQAWDLAPADREACGEYGVCDAHYRCSSCGVTIHLGHTETSSNWVGPSRGELHRRILGDPPRCWDCRQ